MHTQIWIWGILIASSSSFLGQLLSSFCPLLRGPMSSECTSAMRGVLGLQGCLDGRFCQVEPAWMWASRVSQQNMEMINVTPLFTTISGLLLLTFLTIWYLSTLKNCRLGLHEILCWRMGRTWKCNAPSPVYVQHVGKNMDYIHKCS